MASYVQEVEKQNEELQKKLADIQGRYDSLTNGGSFLTSLYCEKAREYSSKDISKLFKVPKVVINSFYRRPEYFINPTLDMAVLHILINKYLGSVVYRHRLWTIECRCGQEYKEFEFRGTIYISSDLKTRVVDTWFKDFNDNESKIFERVNKLIDHGEFKTDDEGRAIL